MASQGYRHYAGTKGSKHIYVGSDLNIYNYDNLADAVEAAQNNDKIFIEPGTYTLTETLTINKPITLCGMGAPNQTIITSALTTRTINLINPATGPAAATYNFFENLYIANSSTGDCIEIDNDGGLAESMVVKFDDCSIINSGGGLAIDLDQTTNTEDVFLYVRGNLAFYTISASNFGVTKAGSMVLLDSMMCSDAMALSATDVAWYFNMLKCNVVSAEATTGGSASLVANYVACLKMAAPWLGEAAAATAGDFDATAGTETVIGLA
jgi:hypothetical protein